MQTNRRVDTTCTVRIHSGYFAKMRHKIYGKYKVDAEVMLEE